MAALSDPARTGRLRRSGAQWDQELHGRILLGDADAFDELYDQYAPMVYGMALRVIRDRTAAADITQEVFAGFWEQPEGFNPGRGSLRSWMGMLAHRRAVDWVRREQVRRGAMVTQAQQAPPPLPNAEEAAMTALAASSVRSALEVVPESQRAVIVMAYFEGRPGREISELLDIPLGTVKSRMRAGLQRLARELRAAGISPEA